METVGFFTLALESTQPEVSPGSKGNRCVGLTILPPSYTDTLEILGASNSWCPEDSRKCCKFRHSTASSGTVILQNRTPIRAGSNNFFYGKGSENQSLGTGFFCTTE